MIVIFAVSLVALLLFVGLAIDAGAAYIAYGQLKRAVDAGAVSAATNFKRNKTLAQMEAAVQETLVLHNVNTDPSLLTLRVRVCDEDGDGVRDSELATELPEFYSNCPDTTLDSPRKLVWVEATQRTPFYFLTLVGFRFINLTTHAISEAAAVDLVIVIDISESMVQECQTYVGGVCTAWKSPGYSSAVAADYDPQASGNCNYNNANNCHPLREAKDAAQALVSTLYEGYDRISLITFDSQAHVVIPLTAGDLNPTSKPTILSIIDGIAPHDDPPSARLWGPWYDTRQYNPVFPDDRDGDGSDTDPLLPCDYEDNQLVPPNYGWWNPDSTPCDQDGVNDAFNWDLDGDETFTAADQALADAWLAKPGSDYHFSMVSTCTGCGMRLAGNELKQNGRPGAVWVMVFLSDGAANMSDTPMSAGTNPVTGDPFIPAVYPNGFCTQRFWGSNCFDTQLSPRYCIDTSAGTCPPDATHEAANPASSHYSAYDYALDMTDEAALTIVDSFDASDPRYNEDEPIGNDIAIYSIGLGDAISYGEPLLRYMAAVGDDGDRNTNPCALTTAKRSCGNYYFAKTGDDLLPIFEDIASRIYYRITQ